MKKALVIFFLMMILLDEPRSFAMPPRVVPIIFVMEPPRYSGINQSVLGYYSTAMIAQRSSQELEFDIEPALSLFSVN